MLYAGATKLKSLIESKYSLCRIGEISKLNYLINKDEASL